MGPHKYDSKGFMGDYHRISVFLENKDRLLAHYNIL